MSKFKHTPGPWEYSGISSESGWVDIVSSGTDRLPIGYASPAWPGTVNDRRDYETVANARLISAAPDLLEALEGVVHFADGFVMYHTESPAGNALRDWINGARAAIAKATGAGHE